MEAWLNREPLHHLSQAPIFERLPTVTSGFGPWGVWGVEPPDRLEVCWLCDPGLVMERLVVRSSEPGTWVGGSSREGRWC